VWFNRKVGVPTKVKKSERSDDAAGST